MAQTQPRGLRNNNPLNIRISASNWRGKIVPSSDPAFEQFENIFWGIRAALYLVRVYLSPKYRCRYVKEVINKWAPPVENNTENYIQVVLSQSGIKANEILEPRNKNQMCRLVWAMAFVEVGQLLPFHYFERAYDLL